MKKSIFLVAMMCMAVMFALSSCSKSKSEMILDGFEDLVEEVEKKKGDLTVEEWGKMQDDFNKRFEALGIKEFDEKEFSAVQKLKLVALTVRWTAAMAKSTPTLMESAAEKAKEQSEKKQE